MKAPPEPAVPMKLEMEPEVPPPSTSPVDRKDKLRKIDADLVAVEEALERRRRSLAEIDQKLNTMQPPGKCSPLMPLRGQEVESGVKSQTESRPPTNGVSLVSQISQMTKPTV